MCASQATGWSLPVMGSEPTANRMLIPNHTTRNNITRASDEDAAQGNSRYPIATGVSSSDQPQRASTLESKTHCGRHRARDRRRCTDHRKLLPRVRCEM